MLHMGQKHKGQVLLPDSVEQLRCLDRGLCSLRDHQVAAMPPLQPLRKRHSSL